MSKKQAGFKLALAPPWKEFRMPSKLLSPFKVSTMMAGRILMVLLVLTSSLAWLPMAAQAAPKTAPSASPKLDTWIIGDRLYVEAWDLQRYNALVLRVRRGSEEKWTKLTSLQANRWGELNKSVRLPSKMRKVDNLQVCLKDKKAGQQYCARAWKLE
jgi:hypothetical protein